MANLSYLCSGELVCEYGSLVLLNNCLFKSLLLEARVSHRFLASSLTLLEELFISLVLLFHVYDGVFVQAQFVLLNDIPVELASIIP